MLSRWLGKKEAVPETETMPERPTRIHAGARVQAFRQRAHQAVAAGTLPAFAFRRQGDDTPPLAGGPQLDAWIDQAIDRTLTLPVTSAHYVLDHNVVIALCEHVEADGEVDLDALARHADGFCMAFERMAVAIVARYAWFSATDERRTKRIVTETAILRDLPREQIAHRFTNTPSARIDPVPLIDIETHDWIEDMLRGEAMMIGGGLIAPVDVARIACRSVLPALHSRQDGDARTTVSFPGFHPENVDTGQLATRAAHLATLSRDIVLARFTAIPGFNEAADRAYDQRTWADLVARAVIAEKVRDVSGLTSAISDEEEVDLVDIELIPDADGMGFSADLHVFGDRVCRLVGAGDGTMVGEEWSEGCSPKDIETLDRYIAATGDPRDDGELPDSFAMRVLDIVSVHTLLEAYLIEREGFALFGVEGADGEMIHREPIADGSTREAVIASYKDTYPRALSLDDLDDLEAAELWLSLMPVALPGQDPQLASVSEAATASAPVAAQELQEIESEPDYEPEPNPYD